MAVQSIISMEIQIIMPETLHLIKHQDGLAIMLTIITTTIPGDITHGVTLITDIDGEDIAGDLA